MRLDRAPNYIVRLILYIVNHEAELAREPPAADADSSNAAAPAPETQRDASQPPSIVRDLYARLHAVGESLMSTSEAFDLWQGYSAEVFTSTLRFILLLIPHTPAHHIELGRQYDTPDLAVRLLGHALSALRPSVHQIGTVEATIAIPPWSTYLYIYLDTFSRHLRDAHRTAAVRARALADPRPHHWQVLTSSTSWSEPSWQDYEPADQLRLEAAFRASRSTMDLPASAENGNPGARVDFNTMTERRNGMTQERRVRRVPQTPTRDTDAAAAAAAVPAVQSEDQEMSVSASGGEERQTRPVEANASASGTEEAAAAAAAVPSSATPTVTPTTAGPGATTITAPSSLFNDSAVEPPSQLSQALRVRLAKLSVAWLNVTLDADMLNALLRTLVLLTRDNKMAVLVAQTGGLRALFELRHGDAFPGLHVAIILIIRHACEDQRTLQHLMEEEILTDSELAAQTFSLRKLVHNMRYAVARSEDAFVAAASNTLELLQPAALGEAPSATVAVKLGSRASQVDHVSAGMTAVLSELLRAIEYRLAHQGDPTSLSAPCLPVTNRDGGLLLAPTWSPPPPAPSLSPPVDPSFALPIFDLPRLLQVLSELVLSYPALAGVLCKQTVKVPSRSSGKSGENGAAATEKSGGGGGATTANHTPVGSAGPSSAQPTPSKSHHVSKTGAAEAGKAFHVANHAAGSAPSSVVRPSKASGGGAATTTTTATPARLPSTGGALPTPGPTASAPGASTTETNNNNSGSNINGVSMLDFLFRHVLMYESHTQYVAGSVGHRRANAAASQAQRVLWAVANCGQSAVEEAWVAAWKAAFLDAGKQPKRAVAYRQQRHLARFLGSVLPARHGTQQRTLSQCALKMELLNLLVDALKSRDINDPSFKDDAESVLQLLALLMRFAQKQHFTSRPAAGADAAGAADAEHGDADVSLDEDRLDAMLEDLFEEGTLEDALLHALAAGNALHHDEGDEELHEIDVDEEGEDDEDHEDDEEDDEYGDDDDEDEDGGEGDDDLHAIDVDELGPEAMEFLMDLQQAGHGDDEDLGDEEMEDEDGADDRDHHHHHQHHEGDHDMDDSALLEGGPGDRVMVVEAGPDGFPEFMDDDEESDEGDVDHDHGSESGDALGEGGASSSEEDDADDDAVDEDDYDDEGGEGIDDYDGEGDAEYMDSGHDDYDLDELEEMGDMGAGGFEHSGFDRANIGWPTRTGRGGRGGAGGAGGVAGGWSYLDYDDDADDLVEDDETMMDGGGFGGGGTGAGHRRLARSNAVRRPPRAPGSFLSGAAQLFSWGGGAGGAGGGAGAGGLSVAPPVAVGAGGAGGAPPTTAGDQYGEMVLSDVHPLVGISTRVEGGSLTANGAAGTAANSTRRLLGLQRRAGGGGTSRDDRALEALEHLLASGQLDHLRDGNRQADVHIYDSETHEQLIARVSDGGVSVELRGGRGGNAHIPSDRQSTTDRLRAEMHILEGGNRGLQDLAEVAQAVSAGGEVGWEVCEGRWGGDVEVLLRRGRWSGKCWRVF